MSLFHFQPSFVSFFKSLAAPTQLLSWAGARYNFSAKTHGTRLLIVNNNKSQPAFGQLTNEKRRAMISAAMDRSHLHVTVSTVAAWSR